MRNYNNMFSPLLLIIVLSEITKVLKQLQLLGFELLRLLSKIVDDFYNYTFKKLFNHFSKKI